MVDFDEIKSLPIFSVKSDLIKSIKKNDILVILGQTGSGKSTQLPQILLQLNYTKIAVTQPRRVAAISLANRVSEEMNCRIGQEVGYTVRFEDCSSHKTKIKYITDGSLLRECLKDSSLRQYDAVVLDEAHERSLQTDILFGVLFDISRERRKIKKKFKLIITSATLDTKKFCDYFQCDSFKIPGRHFPVEIQNFTERPSDYFSAAVNTALQIHKTTDANGHILVFLTGQEEIEKACDLLGRKVDKAIDEGEPLPDIVILPAYSALNPSEQRKIFYKTPKNCRKVVFATNIAETSITVPGVKYVVDCGFVKQQSFNEKTGILSLAIFQTSQSAAAQRAGRAGRTCPGVCYRLYSQTDFAEMPLNFTPEILRACLASVVLLLKTLGVKDVLSFRFMDRPRRSSLLVAMRLLYCLGAIDENGEITPEGRLMARFPLTPSHAKVILNSLYYEFWNKSVKIVALMGVENLWAFERGKREIFKGEGVTNFLKRYQGENADHFVLLGVFEEWEKSGQSEKWALEKGLNIRALFQCKKICAQLINICQQILKSNFVKSKKCGKKFKKEFRKLLAESFFMNSCVFLESHKKGNIYRPLSPDVTSVKKDMPQQYWMRKSSVLDSKPPTWVICNNINFSTKPFMQLVSKVHFDWFAHLLQKVENVNWSKLTGKNEHFWKSDEIESVKKLKRKQNEIFVKKDKKEIQSAKERYLMRKKFKSE